MKSNGKTRELTLHGYAGECERCKRKLTSYAKLDSRGSINKWVDRMHNETIDANLNPILLCLACNKKLSKPENSKFKERYRKARSYYLIEFELAQYDNTEALKFINQTWSPEIAEFYKKLPYETFLKSNYWSVVRSIVIKNYNAKCHVCEGEERLQVHHLRYDNRGNEHNNLQDLIPLCHDCHAMIHVLQESYSIGKLKKITEVISNEH